MRNCPLSNNKCPHLKLNDSYFIISSGFAKRNSEFYCLNPWSRKNGQYKKRCTTIPKLLNFVGAIDQAMNKQIYIVIILFLFSCTNGISEKEEAYIRSRIELHNDVFVFLDFLKDSINNKLKMWDSINYPGKSKHKVQKLTDSIAAILDKKNKLPYNPDSDDQLTYLKFMTYCRQNKIDPVKEAARLRVK